MAKPRLFWRFASDAGTVTASTAATGYAASWLQTSHLADLWKTTGAGTAEWLKVNLGSAITCGAFALLGHDFDGTETGLTLEANSSDSWGAPPLSESVTYRAGSLIHFLTPASYQWWRFKFTKANAADVRSAGRFLVGPYHQMTAGLQQGFSPGEEDLSETSRTAGGQLYADGAAIVRSLEADFATMPGTDADELAALQRAMGLRKPWLFCGDYDNEPLDWSLYGVLRELRGRKWLANDGTVYWDSRLRMDEVK